MKKNILAVMLVMGSILLIYILKDKESETLKQVTIKEEGKDSHIISKTPVNESGYERFQKSIVGIEINSIEAEENTRSGYQTLKVVNDPDELKKLKELLINAPWEENIKVQMDPPPDYRFIINTYFFAIWVTPNGHHLDATIEGEAMYTQFSQKESEIFI